MVCVCIKQIVLLVPNFGACVRQMDLQSNAFACPKSIIGRGYKYMTVGVYIFSPASIVSALMDARNDE